MQGEGEGRASCTLGATTGFLRIRAVQRHYRPPAGAQQPGCIHALLILPATAQAQYDIQSVVNPRLANPHVDGCTYVPTCWTARRTTWRSGCYRAPKSAVFATRRRPLVRACTAITAKIWREEIMCNCIPGQSQT